MHSHIFIKIILLPIKYEKSLFSSLYITLSHIASVRGKSVAYLTNKLFSKLFSNYFPEALQAQHSYFKLIPTSSEEGNRLLPDHSLKKQQILNIMKSFKIIAHHGIIRNDSEL